MVQTRTRRDVTSGLSFIRKGWKKLTRRLRGGLQTRERHPDTDTNTYISFQISFTDISIQQQIEMRKALNKKMRTTTRRNTRINRSVTNLSRELRDQVPLSSVPLPVVPVTSVCPNDVTDDVDVFDVSCGESYQFRYQLCGPPQDYFDFQLVTSEPWTSGRLSKVYLSGELPGECRLVDAVHVTSPDRSLIKMTNRIGPSTLPCCMPLSIPARVDNLPFTTIHAAVCLRGSSQSRQMTQEFNVSEKQVQDWQKAMLDLAEMPQPKKACRGGSHDFPKKNEN
ncbi:hypothetical protein LSH36_441g01050 [Paralvinella palmiformis]|uniref:Uncharacterized protein n=1 Tax=Paralvinella palmiformis TaxID=53620 RepID=A0AAD9JC35_9ANNE|nr:hypothetical protein LSH36_441g01050 [Paralvinella palmiformis]